MAPGGVDSSILIQITGEGMGRGEPELQKKLLRTYLTLLDQNGMLPGAICFYTEGVRLVAEGSPVLDLLRSLEAKGVHLVVCKTCLEYYGLVEKVRVGTIGGMTDIVSAHWKAGKVVSL